MSSRPKTEISSQPGGYLDVVGQGIVSWGGVEAVWEVTLVKEARHEREFAVEQRTFACTRRAQ